MVSIGIADLLIVIMVLCCLNQKTSLRRKACIIYVGFSIVHYLLFELLRYAQVSYPWPLYYISAAICCVFIVDRLQNIREYTQFHLDLQYIGTASIAINGVGWYNHNADTALYTILAYASYTVLILITCQDGHNDRICRRSSRFNLFYRGV